MRRKSEKLRRRRGTITALVAVSMIAIVGVAALSLDIGLLVDEKRRLRAGADAAALAAAIDLFNNYGSNSGLDPTGKAKAAALAFAAANGYTNDGVTSVVTVNIPPTSGIAAGKAGNAEVIIQFNQQRGFSGIFGSATLPVTARGVARGIPGNIGILLLDPQLTVAGQICGNINILNGGQIFCNSDSSVLNDEFKGYGSVGGVYLESTAKLSCGGINVTGWLTSEAGSSLTYTNGGGLQTGGGPWADPLASIPEPTTAGLTNYGSKTTISTTTTMQPGIYTDVTIKSGTVTMAPGLYYFADSGSLVISGGSLSGTGVMIFDNTGGDSVLKGANGVVNLTPPTSTSGGTWPTGTSSATYSGISFWIPRSQTKEVHIESSYNLTMPGTFYAQAGEYDIRPDGASTVFNIGNYICAQAEWEQGDDSKSKSNGTINFNPSTAVATQRPLLIE